MIAKMKIVFLQVINFLPVSSSQGFTSSRMFDFATTLGSGINYVRGEDTLIQAKCTETCPCTPLVCVDGYT